MKRRTERFRLATERVLLDRAPGFAEESTTPFVLVFQPRTGSNMLRTALDGHPNIRCYRELFRNRRRAAEREGAVGIPKRAVPILLDQPTAFLDRYLFGAQPRGVKAVGFKLAYGHAREPEWLPVWRYVAENGIRLLEIRRSDSLAALCSIERARATGQFVAKSHAHHVEPHQLHIPVERCELFFERTESRRQEADALFAHSPRLIMDYEDLVADWDGHANRIQQFLKVPVLKISPNTVRQSTADPIDSIANFDELRKYFQNSRHADHFERPHGVSR